MLDSLYQYGFLAALALVGLIWAIVLVRAWAPRARARGGFWYLEAILLLSAPVLESVTFFYPEDLSGPAPMIARAASLTCVALAFWAMLHSSANARRGTGAIIVATLVYYLSLIVSGIAGATPVVPEQYLTTPLLVLAFLIHGGFSADWFLDRVRFNLRLIVGLSIVSAVSFPSLAFDTEESRTLLGFERLEGITSHPNTLGAVAVVAIVIEMRKPNSKLWLILPLLALAFAQSNTSWIALVVALAIQRSRLGSALRATVVAAVLVASITLIVLPGKTQTLIGTVLDDDITFNGRTRIWEAAMIGFHQFPIFGYGPTLLDEGYRSRYLPNFDAAAQAHNQVVQSLASVGIVGLIAFIVLIVTLFNRAWKLRKLGDATSLSLLLVLAFRAFTETPLRPTGAGLSTFLLIVVLSYVAVAWAEKPATSVARSSGAVTPASVLAIRNQHALRRS